MKKLKQILALVLLTSVLVSCQANTAKDTNSTSKEATSKSQKIALETYKTKSSEFEELMLRVNDQELGNYFVYKGKEAFKGNISLVIGKDGKWEERQVISKMELNKGDIIFVDINRIKDNEYQFVYADKRKTDKSKSISKITSTLTIDNVQSMMKGVAPHVEDEDKVNFKILMELKFAIKNNTLTSSTLNASTIFKNPPLSELEYFVVMQPEGESVLK